MFFNFSDTARQYYLSTRLRGTTGAINSLSFTRDGRFLASGGDDQIVRIWDIEALKLRQLISDQLERWGQITCIKWLSGTADSVLCFGTGRGLVLVYRQETDNFRELSNTGVFPFNDPVESLDYDRHKHRLAMSSHSGIIRVFTIEKNGTLIPIWQKDLNSQQDREHTIPRCARFVGKGENIIVLGLESGLMVSLLASTGAENWKKTLKSSIGSAALSDDESFLLVDNLVKGFDLYHYPRTSPTETFTIARDKAYIHEAIFLEDANSVACGSDHGKLYLYSLETTKLSQTLKHSPKTSLIQVVDACSTSERHLVASGSNDKRTGICIWEKKVKGCRARKWPHCGCSLTFVMLISNILMLACLAYVFAAKQVNVTARAPQILKMPDQVFQASSVTQSSEPNSQSRVVIQDDASQVEQGSGLRLVQESFERQGEAFEHRFLSFFGY